MVSNSIVTNMHKIFGSFLILDFMSDSNKYEKHKSQNRNRINNKTNKVKLSYMSRYNVTFNSK